MDITQNKLNRFALDYNLSENQTDSILLLQSWMHWFTVVYLSKMVTNAVTTQGTVMQSMTKALVALLI